MSEYYGGDYIGTTLANTSAVTDLVGTRIYNDRIIPVDNTNDATINYYRVSPQGGGEEIFQVTWSIDCRAATQADSEDIATEVVTALNRVYTTVNSKLYYGVATVLPTIGPIDEADVYNTPVQLSIVRK